jgi:diadenosine tetraphosphate (Ap4A) HIT family hydrolase
MYDENNVFAKVIRGEIPATKVYEDEAVMAFEDISPAAPKHVLVVPKGKYTSFADFVEKAGEKAVAGFFSQVGKIAESLGIKESGYRVIANNGRDASQTVPHFHVHILGGKALGPLISGDRKIR